MNNGPARGSQALQPSIAALIVLRDLGDADGKRVIKVALLELVAADAWRLKEVRRMLRRPLFGFALGEVPAPRRTLLPLLSSVIGHSPSVTHRGETLHELEAVVRQLLKLHHTPRSILDTCLEDLAVAGLVADSHKTVRIGETSRRISVRHRTAEGEKRLADGPGSVAPGISRDDLRYLFELGAGPAEDREGSAFDRAYEASSALLDAPGSRSTPNDDIPAAGWEQYGAGYRSL